MIYDLAIIGSGPAGLSASVYASRYGIKNVVIGGVSGGLASQTHEIGNWLGTQKITGFEFAQKAVEHAKSYGAEIVASLVDEVKKEEESFILFLSSGKKIQTKAVLLAMGTRHRHLGIPGEKEFFGKGVSYCATCDGFFYKGKTVAVVGGNDSAAAAAVFLGDIAEKVYLIYRGEKIRCESCWHDSIGKNSKIKILYNTNLKEITGEDKVKSVTLDNPYEKSETLNVDGVFAEIGSEPDTALAKNIGVEVDDENHIKIDSSGKTNVKGVWAAGDITNGSDKFKQISTAVAEGAIAVHSIEKFLKK
jgi:thioredoxin reductase (NADPH)